MCGNDDFARRMTKTKNGLEVKPKAFPSFDFASDTIENTEYGYLLHQPRCAESLEGLSLDATLDEYRTLCHELAWLSITRPNVCARANISSQVTEILLSQKHVKLINRAVKEIKRTTRRILIYNTLHAL